MNDIANNSDSHFEFIKYGNEEKHLSKQEERRNYITPMILKLEAAGYSIRKIADELDLSKIAVYRFLKDRSY